MIESNYTSYDLICDSCGEYHWGPVKSRVGRICHTFLGSGELPEGAKVTNLSCGGKRVDFANKTGDFEKMMENANYCKGILRESTKKEKKLKKKEMKDLENYFRNEWLKKNRPT